MLSIFDTILSASQTASNFTEQVIWHASNFNNKNWLEDIETGIFCYNSIKYGNL